MSFFTNTNSVLLRIHLIFEWTVRITMDRGYLYFYFSFDGCFIISFVGGNKLNHAIIFLQGRRSVLYTWGTCVFCVGKKRVRKSISYPQTESKQAFAILQAQSWLFAQRKSNISRTAKNTLIYRGRTMGYLFAKVRNGLVL